MEKEHLEIILDEMNLQLDMLIASQKASIIESEKFREKMKKSLLIRGHCSEAGL